MSSTVIIKLPWMHKDLNPNAGGSWKAKYRLKKQQREYAFMCTKQALKGGRVDLGSLGYLPVEITFHPPDLHRRDRDNMIAAFKSAQDGIADALGIDDSLFVTTYHVGHPVPGGTAVVEVRA